MSPMLKHLDRHNYETNLFQSLACNIS